MKIFYIKFRSSIENLNVAETFWNYFLSNLGFSEDKEYWINLSIHEIAVNAIIHGNKNNPNKWVEISMMKMRDFLKIEIKDEGSCKKYPKIEDPGSKKNIYKNHGRGLYIVKKCCDDLKFKILPEGNLKVILKAKIDCLKNETFL